MYLSLLMLHFIGLALSVGTGFSMLRIGASTRDMEPAERTKLMLRVSVLAKNSSAGLGLLILSGLGMLFMRGVAETFRWGGPAFHAKLTLVVLMIGLFGYLQVIGKKVREAGGGPLMARLPKLSMAMVALGVATIVCAVIAFK